MGIYNEEFFSINSLDPLITQVRSIYFIYCIITTTKPMATKFGKIVTYYKRIQPIKSYNPLNTSSLEVT